MNRTLVFYALSVLQRCLLGLTLAALVPSVLAQNPRQLALDYAKTSEKRTALVIGNGDYQNARKLVNHVLQGIRPARAHVVRLAWLAVLQQMQVRAAYHPYIVKFALHM